MIGLLIHWRGLQYGQHVDSAIMEYVASSFGATLMAVVGCEECQLFAYQYEDLDEAISENPGFTFVCMVPKDSVPSGQTGVDMENFVHPDDAIYVIGSDDIGFDIPDTGTFVYIDTPNSANHPLFSFQVATLILHDRFQKGLI